MLPSPTPVKGDLVDLAPTAGPSLTWSSGVPMLRMEDAVVETVVTHTTRTTTSFAPIQLPRIPPPDDLPIPHSLAPEVYPLAREPCPEDMKFFAINLGGRRVYVQEGEEVEGRGAGWKRCIPTGAAVEKTVKAVTRRQRPVTPEPQSPPRKRVRPVSPVSPEPLGGTEVAALMSLPALVNHFDTLPDKLQQHILMHLFRRSRMPTIQRVSAFAANALKRDFISVLPQEIAIQILKRTDTRTLAAATRVSRKWHKLIDSERSIWLQRLIDDDLHSGLGCEEEDEEVITTRFETIDQRAGYQSNRAVPLKHVYRRRYTATENWKRVPKHHSFPGHGTNVVTCTQFDDDKIVTASDDHSINVYDIRTGQLLKRLDGHEGGVWALEYYGDIMVTGSTDRTIRVWDLEKYQETHVFHGHTSTVRCLQIIEPVLDEATGEYQPPYPMFITGSRDAIIRLWKLPKKGEPRYQSPFVTGDDVVPPEENPYHILALEGHTQAVRSIVAYGRLCMSASYDTTVRVWDIVKGTCLHVLTGHEGRVYSIVYDRHRNRCASGSMDNTVRVWDVETGTCLSVLTGHTSLVGLLDVSPNFIVSAAADASLRVWDANTHEERRSFNSHGSAITCFAHDEHKVVSGSDGSLKLWDLRSGKFIRDLAVGINSVWQVVFKDNILVAATNRGGNTVFEIFNFGKLSDPSGVDDESLDKLRRPPWERGNPREPHTYQYEDEDDSMSRRRSSRLSRRKRFEEMDIED